MRSYINYIQYTKIQTVYRVTMVVEYLGLVDYDFGYSPVCLVLLWQIGIWQNRLVDRVQWWNITILSQPNQGT